MKGIVVSNYYPVTVLGGLPLLAKVDFPKHCFWGIDPSGWNPDPSVESLCWAKRNGKKGAEISEAMWEKLRKDPYWDVDVIEQVSEAIAYYKSEYAA